MVEILCPHCEEEIELEDNVFGTFECPHCESDFEWEDSSLDVIFDLFNLDFYVGLLSPFLVMIVSFTLMFILFNPSGFDGLFYGLIAIVLLLITAIGLGIFGYVNERISMAIGAGIPLALAGFLGIILSLDG